MFKDKQKAIAVAITAMVILAGVAVLFSFSDRSHQILRADDYLRYSISGFSNNTTFTASYNVTIADASESGVSYTAIGESLGLARQIADYGHDFTPYDPPSLGESIGHEKISTAFGTKNVKMMLDYHLDEVILADVGLDSLIVYRWVVSSLTGEYHYTYELTSTNNARISTVDSQMEKANVKVLNTPAPHACMPSGFGLSPMGSTFSFFYGSVEVGQGQQFHYVLGGYVTMLVFSIADFKSIEETGQFHYNSTLSRLPGNPGETNETVSPGIYWFRLTYQGSDTGVDFHGEQAGGYIVPYFGLKGQDF